MRNRPTLTEQMTKADRASRMADVLGCALAILGTLAVILSAFLST